MMNFNRLPALALAGRPNVGKSTLFNRLIGQRKAIVDDAPGVTRDRNYGETEWRGERFVLIDTGGFEPDPETHLKKQIQQQARLAMEEADVILFLFDGKAGLNPLDREAAKLLRSVEKPVFFAVNKIDSKCKEDRLYEFYALGLSEIFPLSAEHGLGLSELMDRIVGSFPAAQSGDVRQEEQEGPLRLTVVGRPNVGKSTLVNCLLGFERSVVDPLPGTTRDTLDSPFSLEDEECVLVDTAGIRRKARITDRIERFSVIRSLRSVDHGDLVIHLLDGPEGVTDQDAQILSYAFSRGKGLVLAVNKWDLVSEAQRDGKSYGEAVYRKLSFVDFAPIVFISALKGEGMPELAAAIRRVAVAYRTEVRTSTLNRALREAVGAHAPPLARGREVKFFYATQTGRRPPTFTVFVNSPAGVSADYRRYLVHVLRRSLRLDDAPVRVLFRARRNAVERSGKKRKEQRAKSKGEREKEVSRMKVKVAIEASEIGVRAVRLGAKRKRALRAERKDRGRVSERWQRAARRELQAYFAGRLRSFATPCDLYGLTPFTRAVLRITAKIPYGELRSYRWVARRLGRPRATRAVGNALAKNPIPILIPCHRVVRSDGALGGYALGLAWKRRLLKLEHSRVTL